MAIFKQHKPLPLTVIIIIIQQEGRGKCSLFDLLSWPFQFRRLCFRIQYRFTSLTLTQLRLFITHNMRVLQAEILTTIPLICTISTVLYHITEYVCTLTSTIASDLVVLTLLWKQICFSNYALYVMDVSVYVMDVSVLYASVLRPALHT